MADEDTPAVPSPQLRQRPDTAALPEPKTIAEAAADTTQADLSDVGTDDLGDADEPAPVVKVEAPLPTSGPYTALATIVRDSHGRTVAVCGGSHMHVDQRARLATAIANALNS